MKQTIFLFIGIVAGIILGGILESRSPTEGDIISREVYYDTIPYYKPVPKDSVVIRYETATLPIAAPAAQEVAADTLTAAVQTTEGDSAKVVIPITQTTYEDSTYTAYVSGYRARLDSIFVYPRREVVTIKKPPKRWSIGVQAGYGYTPKGFQPYIGVGISCKLWEF